MAILATDILLTEYFKEIHVSIDALKGTQNRGGDYGSVTSSLASEGKTKILCDFDISDELFVSTANWIVSNSEKIVDSSLRALMPQYFELRKLVLESLTSENGGSVVPEIINHVELKKLCGVIAIYVHNKSNNGEFTVGIEFGCNWEEEHGAGCLLEGLKVVESGGAEVAF